MASMSSKVIPLPKWVEIEKLSMELSGPNYGIVESNADPLNTLHSGLTFNINEAALSDMIHVNMQLLSRSHSLWHEADANRQKGAQYVLQILAPRSLNRMLVSLDSSEVVSFKDISIPQGFLNHIYFWFKISYYLPPWFSLTKWPPLHWKTVELMDGMTSATKSKKTYISFHLFGRIIIHLYPHEESSKLISTHGYCLFYIVMVVLFLFYFCSFSYFQSSLLPVEVMSSTRPYCLLLILLYI